MLGVNKQSKRLSCTLSIQAKTNPGQTQIVDQGDSILDVGCHPGGWAQVAVELVGSKGKVVGVDLQSCVPVEGANLIVGDITEPFTQQAVLDAIDTEVIDVVVSDISPRYNWEMGY